MPDFTKEEAYHLGENFDLVDPVKTVSPWYFQVYNPTVTYDAKRKVLSSSTTKTLDILTEFLRINASGLSNN
jgi:hypothetical protein